MDGPMSSYRVVVSREDPWWVATAYGEGLPEHGAVTESRTIAGLEDTVRDLIVLRTDADLRMPYNQAAHSFGLDWEYDLPSDAAAKLESYRQSKFQLTQAQAAYADRLQQAASVLADEVHASVRDIARLMGISYQRVRAAVAAGEQADADGC
jgi:hypothetical protein